MSKKCKRSSQPQRIGEILPEVMAKIKKRIIRHRNREKVGAKRNEHNRSSLRRVAATERT